jgi:hypothetical protein
MATDDLEKFLNEQDDRQKRGPLEAIVERVSSSTHVRVTPWLKGQGCLCDAAVELPKSSIESVVKTSEVHVCCGKKQPVVELTFKAEHAELISSWVRQQLLALRPPGGGGGGAGGGGPGKFYCQRACSICQRFPWKTGPCSVCESCGGDDPT